jgi:uncharacterized protein YggT (Ycf19 family)
MWLLNLILNMAGLLLWLKWSDPSGREMAGGSVSLLATLRRTQPRAPGVLFASLLLGLLLFRALIYWQLGSALEWTPSIHLTVVAVPFRSDHFSRMLIFSYFSFGVTLLVFYIGLLLLDWLAGNSGDPVQKLIRGQLGRLANFPDWIKIVLPGVVAALAWGLATAVLLWMNLVPSPRNALQLAEQAGILGLVAYLVWKYVLIGLLGLYVLNSYIYFGASPIWGFIDRTGRNFLRIFSALPLRAGKIDFAPVFAIVVLLAVGYGLEYGLGWCYRQVARGV